MQVQFQSISILKICLLPPNLRLFLVFDLAVDLAVPKKNNFDKYTQQIYCGIPATIS